MLQTVHTRRKQVSISILGEMLKSYHKKLMVSIMALLGVEVYSSAAKLIIGSRVWYDVRQFSYQIDIQVAVTGINKGCHHFIVIAGPLCVRVF